MTDSQIENINNFSPSEENEAQVLTTNCQKCVFGTYEGKTQIGCSAGKLDAYRDKGVNIIEAEDLEENEFYVIEAWCAGYREEEWAIIHEDEDLLDVLKEETKPRVGFFILVSKETPTCEGLEKTIDSIIKEGGDYIVVVRNLPSEGVKYASLIENTEEIMKKHGEEIGFKVMQVLEPSGDLHAIDEAFANAQQGYYSVINSGEVVKSGMIDTLNRNINEKLDRVGYIKGYDGINGLTVLGMIHKYMAGNINEPLEEKIANAEKLDDSATIIRTWEQLDDPA